MTEEKAIQILKSYSGMTHKITDNQGRPKLDQAIETALNLIQKQQAELEKKDKIIDLMIEEYNYNVEINVKNFCEEEIRTNRCIQDCKPCIKQYFEKQVEKE